MPIFKNAILAFSLIFLVSSCSESNKKISAEIEEVNPKLTSSNFVKTLLSSVKHSSNEPFFYLFVSHEACYFELLVNGLPVYHNYNLGQTVTPIDIYSAINKSGKQTITYKLYPQTESQQGEGVKTLVDFTNIKIEVFKRNKADTGKNAFVSEKPVLTHTSLTEADGKTFIGKGKDYYEYSFTFDATVPYENTGWENSTDLSKMDQKELLTKTENAYKQVWQMQNDEKVDDFFALLFNREKENAQCEYSTKNDLEESLENYKIPLSAKNYKMQKLENYKMVLYGGGRLVRLEQTSVDKRLRSESALWAKYKDEDGNVIANFISLYLHIPKGKTNFEIIR
ncbi:hypothetical protein [Pedobacter heparinus]|uniref:Lipoprotein n=1 Tax=Pedobacter heparinus (strain ATCC 13125 / DSM 2366 / CIP 104194 / JCM 7457 / NBRC 12017 / NCIMB 9290 / NRRL B-14731 / HIM 762-3) TaxID=485917 RepID=C6XTS2_PEDHD|nr:hypothetical protein [Pedobacter heparinus]ACU03708.1 hypothetical protein Phep_1494 [Pedobacter heparinus DSM 2366]